jgi:hypothetical protein
MKALLFASALLVGLAVVPASAAGVVFYTGVFDPSNSNANGLANEQDLIVSQAADYVPFDVGAGGLTVNGLFTNNLMGITALSADWEIRSGVSEGDGGTLVASGSATPTVTDTGIQGFGFDVFEVEVTGLDVVLSSGEYWMSVVPVCTDVSNGTCDGRSFLANTFGLNSIGSVPQNSSYFNSSFFGTNFTNANNESGVYPAFSAGVEGVGGGTTPEPASLVLFGGGLLLLAGIRRRSARREGALTGGTASRTPPLP